MSDTNTNNNDKNLQAKRYPSSDSTTNRDTSTKRMSRLEAIPPHDDPTSVPKMGAETNGLGARRDAPPSGKPKPALRLAKGRPFFRAEAAASEEDANRQVATPSSTGTRGAGLKGTVSISSWEAHFPEADEQFEPAVEPAVAPGAFPVPGAHPSRVNDDFTITDQDSTLPSPEIHVTAHAVNEDEENQVRQDQLRIHQRLDEIQAMMDHAVIANVVSGSSEEPRDIESDNQVHDTETGDGKHTSNVDNEPDGTTAMRCVPRKRNLFIVAGVVVLLAIIVGITIPVALKQDSPSLEPTPAPLAGVWTRIGNDLIGEASRDLFGESIALSGDGGIVAVGAPYNDGNGINSGSVCVYQQNVDAGTSTWTRLGSEIDGANAYDWFGQSVALSDDGTVLAVGAIGNDSNGTTSGQLRVLRLVNNDWRPIGDPINGRTEGDWFGSSVALSADGTIVAGGAQIGGYTQVHRLQNGNWNRVGSDVSGQAESVSLSHDGTVLGVK